MDEDAAEGEDTAHHDAGDGLGVEALLGDLARDLVGPHWVLDSLISEWMEEILFIYLSINST